MLFTNATTGSSNIAIQESFGGQSSFMHVELKSFKFHLGTASTASNTLSLTQKSKRGSAYDFNFFSQPMNGVQDILWAPDEKVYLNSKDRLAIAWTNDAASFKTWGYELTYDG